MDLLAAGLLPSLPASFLSGGDLDLLAPLAFTAGPELPPLPAGTPAVESRRGLAEALATANAAYGHPRARDLARRLADPATRVVAAGQQPGLLGGPLYTLVKAVAAARWAERLEAAGQPAVAVFWVATEDHDFRELSRASLLTAEGPRTFTLGADPSPLMPVGMRTLGESVTEVLAAIAAATPGDRYAAWVERLAAWYRPEARFGEAFCRLFAHLLGERCPLLLDAMLPAVKAAERPWLGRLIEARREVDAALKEADRRIREAGHPLQVPPQPGASPLFLLRRGERRKVEWEGDDGFSLRGQGEGAEPVANLLEIVEENPGVVSPGVLARPVLQDALLGTALFVAGPGELSYLPQAAPLYRLLDVPAPAVALRPQVLVLEGHRLEKLPELSLTLEDLVAPGFDLEDLDRALAGRGIGFLEEAEARLGAVLDALREPALAIAPDLERPWEKTRDQATKALATFAAKVRGAAARRDDVRRRRALDLREACRPAGELQERFVSSSHFPGKYGEAFVASLFAQLHTEAPATLQVIVP